VTSLLFFSAVAVVLSVVFLIILRTNSRPRRNHTSTINDLLPVRHQHFEEVERRLVEYENTLQRANSERRKLALAYLDELQADFEEVTFLLNRAAKFLPELTVSGESRRAALALRFRTECAIARLQIRSGVIPAMRLSVLTDKVRSLARIADEFLSVIAQERGLPVLESDLKR
jgi:hypothetical protein